MHRPAQRASICLAPLASAVLLAGCVAVQPFDTPSIGPASAALNSRESIIASQPALDEASAPQRWWDLFNDSTLTDLEVGIESNLTLRAAALRIEESRAQLGLADARRRPNVGANAGYARDAISENSPIHQLGAPTAGYDTWSLGLQAAWEIDLWGHLQHLSASARANLQATYYDSKAARVSVTAELARTYLVLRGVQAQESIVNENLDIARNLVRLAQSRQRNGVVSKFDAVSARADVSALEARATQLHHERAALMNAVARLSGKAPRELDAQLATAPLPSMPSRLPIGIPSELAKQRPDILQAEAKLRAAVADIGAAKADFYPRISLTGTIGMQAFNLSDLGSWASRQYAFGPSLYLPIFEGGRLRRQLELTEVRHRLAAIAYQDTVLQAWHEVDDALGAYASELKRHEQLQSAMRDNQTALTIARRSYQQGAADFTTVLIARRTLLASQADLTDSATASALAVVSLYRALGGGWSPELNTGAAPKATS